MNMAVDVPGPVARYLAALDRLAPMIAARRDDFDRDRRLPDDLFEAMSAAGLFKLYLPKSFGGPELSPFDFMSVVEAASELDGSVGWLVGNGGGISRMAAVLPEPVAREIFEPSTAFVVAATGTVGTLTSVEGGYRLTGRWPFGSGAHHASHFMGLAAASDGPVICCYFGRNDVTVEDSWRTSGLRGTGSCHFSVTDVFVPDAWTHPFLGSRPRVDGVAYRLPPVSAFGWTVATVPLGIAEGAIKSFVEVAAGKGRGEGGPLLRDRETIQAMVGRLRALHGAARAFLVQSMTDLIAAQDVGGEHLDQARARLRTSYAHAAETAIQIAQTLQLELGALSIFETFPLERATRDINAAAKHIAMNPNLYALAGRLELGLAPGTDRF